MTLIPNPDLVVLHLCGLSDGHVPNLTVGPVQAKYQSMLQNLYCFALLAHRDLVCQHVDL